MSWEWSHTVEGQQNARANLASMGRGDLAEIYSEIKVANFDSETGEYVEAWTKADCRKAARFTKQAMEMPSDVLVDFIWDFMCEFRTCDNGGFNAYCCPYGCHTVPFDREEDDDA